MNKRITLLAVLALALPLTLQAAKITSTTGKTEIYRSSDKGWQSAAAGEELVSGSKVRCGARARAEILTTGGHKVRLWSKSEISVDNVDGAETKIGLVIGRLRSWVKKMRSNEKFEIKTPVAVCSVRGTDFMVEVDENKLMRVEVYEGQVAAGDERTGAQVLLNPGQFIQMSPNQPPQEPKALPDEQKTGSDEGVKLINETREEARNEIFQELSKESVLSRADEEIKLAEYQNGKAMIDVSGNRVRLEEYIVRTNPNEFKYVVLNSRAERFDFGKIVFTFNSALPEDLTLATKNMFTYEGEVKPGLWLTNVISVMSNTQDQVNEEAGGGDMFVDDPVNPSYWTLGFSNYKFSVNNKTWWEFSDANTNGILESGEISYYNVATGAKLSFSTDFTLDADTNKYYFLDSAGAKVYFNEFQQPTGQDSFHFYQKNNYTSDQWITAEDYVINDDGKIISAADLRGFTAQKLKDKTYESNFERVYTCSEFQGRKIDLVFSVKLLVDSGILQLPDFSKLSQ